MVSSVDVDGSADLPGIDGLAVDVSGWTEDESNPSKKSWYQPDAVLSLNYFPIPPT